MTPARVAVARVESSPAPVALRVAPSIWNTSSRCFPICDMCTSSAPSTSGAERAWRSMLSSSVSVE